jgi:hypothetical protein
MTTARTTAAHGPERESWVPVDACTLPTAEQPLRVAAFDDLFATSLREVRRDVTSGPGARLVLAGDSTLPTRVGELVKAESSCCSFFEFDVEHLEEDPSGATVLALDIRVPEAHRDVLEGLLARL